MAGFYIVMMSLVAFVIIGIIYAGFQLCAILGIVFGVITLVMSDRFIKTEGKTAFRSAKGINTAATVFFVISCITGGITLLLFAVTAAGAAADPEESFDFITMLVVLIIGCGTQIACVVTKLISGKRFREARELWNRLNTPTAPYSESFSTTAVYSTAAATYSSDNEGGEGQGGKPLCPYCGAENNDINRYCVRCGETLKQ